MHFPIPHTAIVETLVDTLSRRQISVVDEEFAVSNDGREMFGVLRFGHWLRGMPIRNWRQECEQRTIRLACTVVLRVFGCQSLEFSGDFSPVLAKHSQASVVR